MFRIYHCLKRTNLSFFLQDFSIFRRQKTNVCIVGSGPSGFYTANYLMKKNSDIEVDIVEKIPIPFGLIRYGVAPDHPEIKKVIEFFNNTISSDRCSFYGNINVGKDISVDELLRCYNAVVLAYGASEDRTLGIPGEGSKNVLSARTFVGWYNGLPENVDENIDLSAETAVIIGHGNVALDVARMLLHDPETLKTTDVAEHALEGFRKSKVKRVLLVGRRGPLQVGFTIKEIRDTMDIPGCFVKMHAADFEGVSEFMPSLDRPKNRIMELLLSAVDGEKRTEAVTREFEVKFYRTPKLIVPDGSSNEVQKIVFGINKPQGSPDSGNVESTEEEETIDCGLVVRGVGYKSTVIDAAIPFDYVRNIAPNIHGRVIGKNALYCSGWLKTGPIGVVPTTMNSSYDTSQRLVLDLEQGDIPKESRPGSEGMLSVLKSRGVQVTTFDHWRKIDSEERRRGALVGKPREKICRIEEMLRVINLV